MRRPEAAAVRHAAQVIEREAAVRAVREQLEREYREWRAKGVDALRTAVADVEEHELVWLVGWDSEEYLRTGNPASRLAGNGPYLVDRVDGGLHTIGAVSAVPGAWEADYRDRIRGLPVRTAVDDLHDELRELAAARGRTHAARALRRKLPVLSPADALAYVGALPDGEAPAPLVAVVTKELVQPLDPVLRVTTVLSGAAAGRSPEDEPAAGRHAEGGRPG